MLPSGDDLFSKLKNTSEAGEKAAEIMSSDVWIWIEKTILGALEDEAMQTLRIAKNDEDRLKAQQMFLASKKPGMLLESLVQQGRAAREQLSQFSNLKEGE